MVIEGILTMILSKVYIFFLKKRKITQTAKIESFTCRMINIIRIVLLISCFASVNGGAGLSLSYCIRKNIYHPEFVTGMNIFLPMQVGNLAEQSQNQTLSLRTVGKVALKKMGECLANFNLAKQDYQRELYFDNEHPFF